MAITYTGQRGYISAQPKVGAGVVVRLLSTGEGAVTDLSVHQSASRRFGVGARDRCHRDSEMISEYAMRREPRPR